ncbi:MAG: type 4a pilus biogenesis protein PilO [Myxococcota bacterium]|jgi:type IV pilus assembly protein PilO|nr:type 4a pilus biogenesis protein PilO [Myxococcota bacterium]
MAFDFDIDLDAQLEQIAKVPKPIRLAIAAVLLASVAVGYGFISYEPKAEKVELLQAKVQKLERKLSSIRAVVANLEAFEREVATLEVEFKKARRRLPEGKQFEDLLSDITNAGKKVGVRIKSIQRQPEIPHDFYAEVPFQIEIDGSYHNLARFFERVGGLPRIVNVGELDLRVEKEGPDGTNLRLQGTATTFRFLNDVGSVKGGAS